MANDIAEKKERLERQLDFCLEIDKEKTIVRETYLADESRKETDAEHAWHMAVMAMVLSEYANEKVDTGRVIQMLLIHDLVEIYAGTPSRTTRRARRRRGRAKRAARTACSPSSPRIRRRPCALSGKSLRRGKRLKRNSRGRLIGSNR